MDRQRIAVVLGLGLWAALPVAAVAATRTAPAIVDHTCTDIERMPAEVILAAKATLHIGYGHTAHGSQIVSGMSGLVAFVNDGGRGMPHQAGMFGWNHGGSGGALDLHDCATSGNVGYYPDWVNNIRSYLNSAGHENVDVLMWSWCGQVSGKYAAGRLFREYLTLMSQLAQEYPHVAFVHMTGHVDHGDDSNNKAANQVIREYCRANNKVLFDFADIESYDPDGKYYAFPSDNCDYCAEINGSRLGNWAVEWQNSHTRNVDWYSCDSAHSEPLNANPKAYAVWWLWARLAGWPGPAGSADLDGDGRVDGRDLALLAQQWLTETTAAVRDDETDTPRRRR